MRRVVLEATATVDGTLAHTFIQHDHPLPPSSSDLVHYGWRLDPSRSHCTARNDTPTLGEGGDRKRARQGTREEFCHFYFIGTPTSSDRPTPPIRPHKCVGVVRGLALQSTVDALLHPSDRRVSPTGAGPVDNLYSQ